MKKTIIGMMLCLVLLTSLVMARMPASEIGLPPNGDGCSGASNHEIDTPIDWPDEPNTPTQTTVYNRGHSHKKVLECQEGTLCEVTVCDGKRVEVNKDNIRYSLTVRNSYGYGGKVVHLATNTSKTGVMTFRETLMPIPNEQGCFEVTI